MTTPTTFTAPGALVALWRHSLAGLRVLLGFTVVLGIAYPLVVTGIGQATMSWHANGSMVAADGSHTTDRANAVGSTLIGQSFGEAGTNPQWFHSRPSASNYDTLASGGTNLGPDNSKLVDQITGRRAAVAAADGVAPGAVPADALTASASGLDPHISPAYAAEQVDRVAAARGLDPDVVRALVATYTTGRDLGFLGQPRVDVVQLNLALGRLG